jgi:hypothetical protein
MSEAKAQVLLVEDDAPMRKCGSRGVEEAAASLST